MSEVQEKFKDELRPSGDRKTRFFPTQKNTFGLLPGRDGTCPHSTIGEGGCWNKAPGRKMHTCYVDGVMSVYKGVYGVLAHNTYLLTHADKPKMKELLEKEFTRFLTGEKNRANKKPEYEPQPYYRLHWSGDIFSMDYAEAIAESVKKFPQITFWNYTRSFFAIPVLAGINNLTQYLSLDPVNAQEGLRVYDQFKYYDNIKVCYMGKENDFLAKHVGAYSIKRTLNGGEVPVNWIKQLSLSPCPVDTGKIPLEGGCAVCQKCIGSRTTARPIWFKT